MFGMGLLYMVFGDAIGGRQDWLSKSILGLQVGLIGLAMVVTQSSVRSLQSKQGLPLGNQVVGWAVLVLSLTAPFLHGLRPQTHYFHRLMVIFLTFSPIFVVLTISYEGLFYVVFCLTLVAWVRLEHKTHTHSAAGAGTETTGPHRALVLADARTALFFFFLLQVAFFSTGNIASISSFSLDSVYRLIPVFDPFAMGALLLFKLMIPFAVISANLGVLNRRLGVAPSALFMVVMAGSDVLTLNFFYLVRDEGSWLDIGTSISHFCICGMLGVFVSVLELLSEVFVGGVTMDGGEEVAAVADGGEKRGVKGKGVKGKGRGGKTRS